MKFRSSETTPQAAYQGGTFYTKVFGWDFSPFQGPEDFWPITQELFTEWEMLSRPGTRREPELPVLPAQPIAVVSLEEASQRILNQGGKILTAPIAVPGAGQLVYCQDETGHAFGILEPTGAPVEVERIEETDGDGL